jgi:hypothetical protein
MMTSASAVMARAMGRPIANIMPAWPISQRKTAIVAGLSSFFNCSTIVITALVAVIHRCAGVEPISLRSAQCFDTFDSRPMDCRNKSGNDNMMLFGSD